MNQADLAQLAGTSRESVSRFLADLERAGVVRPGRGRVTVLEPGEAPQLHLLRWRDFADASRARDGRAAAAPARHRRRAGAGGDGGGAARGVRAGALRRRAYADSALPIGEGQTISQPWIVAAICQALELSGGERVLEVGTGSGYSAACSPGSPPR